MKPRSARAASSQRISRKEETISGWLFCLPMIVILGVFLFIPIVMALWVSFSNWTGRGTPFGSNVQFIGLKNYTDVLVKPGLAQSDFGTAIRNNLWYTLLVIPLQTLLSLLLAVMLNRKILKARGFFRTVFYFPSVTSSVAITVLWLFLFNASGTINAVLGWFGINGPNWFNEPTGIIHILLSAFGVDAGPAALTEHSFLGVSLWDWLSGPSVAMFAIILMVVFTTSGTYMLMFIAALQSIGEATEEAAIMDGATSWQRLWKVTVPQLKPTIFTVVTLGIIGTWQVFDQIYTGTQGGPAKTTLTPAYLSYSAAFNSQEWGRGAAISFVLFLIIIVMTWMQRQLMKDKKMSRRRQADYAAMKAEARAMSKDEIMSLGRPSANKPSGGAARASVTEAVATRKGA
ncbi:carbohydrate ABC transporter permease [Bifidobacterium oedipodis]|uniref:ABC transporter permease n=1 Tax=Bifidobacterium oedipodis TaxID=2675322 RepID=A0A7Y0ET74_9BIFI|nr:sugar ABC transporter permease [Bifidobacterium sp. DSM 109957]NMM94931.1 ABC transporter permease [Bifidobacterium sp. DSM 109957]